MEFSVKKLENADSLIAYDVSFGRLGMDFFSEADAFSEEPLENFSRDEGCSIHGKRLPPDMEIGTEVSIDILDPIHIGKCILVAKDNRYLPDEIKNDLWTTKSNDDWWTFLLPNGKLLFVYYRYICISGTCVY